MPLPLEKPISIQQLRELAANELFKNDEHEMIKQKSAQRKLSSDFAYLQSQNLQQQEMERQRSKSFTVVSKDIFHRPKTAISDSKPHPVKDRSSPVESDITMVRNLSISSDSTGSGITMNSSKPKSDHKSPLSTAFPKINPKRTSLVSGNSNTISSAITMKKPLYKTEGGDSNLNMAVGNFGKSLIMTENHNNLNFCSITFILFLYI